MADTRWSDVLCLKAFQFPMERIHNLINSDVMCVPQGVGTDFRPDLSTIKNPP